MAEPKPDAAPAPVLPERVPLIAPAAMGGKTVYVRPEEAQAYMLKGFDDPSWHEPAQVAGQEPGALDYALGGAEQFLAGRTLGLSNAAADVLAGGANMLAETAGYQGPRAAGPGLNAPVLPEDTGFVRGMEAQQRGRAERAEALGPVASTLLQVGGGLSTLAGKGVQGLLGSITAAPTLLAERAGQRFATKLIGEGAEAAALTAAQRIARGALAAGIEGAIGGGAAVASEAVPQIIENPTEAAKDIALGTAAGAALGSAFGGALGLGAEGLGRLAGRAGRARAALEAPAVPAVDAPRPALDVAPEITQRASQLASQLPDEPKTLAQTVLTNANALAKEGEVTEAAIRSATDDMTRLKQIDDELLARQAGIAAKRDFNREAFAQMGGSELTDEIDPDMAKLLGDAELRRSGSQAQVDDLTSQLAAAQTAAGEAAARRLAAREALDAAGDPNFKPSKAARARMKEMGLDDLGTSDIEPAKARVASRIEELQGELSAQTAAEPPMTLTGQHTFGDGMQANIYRLPDNRGSARLDFDPGASIATVGKIDVDSELQRSGLGTRMYAQMFDDAAAQGRRMASDVDRSVKAQSWWEKQVKLGNAEYNKEVDRFFLNKRPIPAAGASAKDAARIAAELDDLSQIQRQLGRPAAGEYAALRKALKDADARVKTTTKQLDDLNAGLASAKTATQSADAELTRIGQPRKMTRMESEGRKMFSELKQSAKDFAGKVAGADEKAALQLVRQTEEYESLFKDFMAKGDIEGAYNAVDQGYKRSIADFVHSTKSGAAEEFAKGIHDAPASFLERTDLFGQAAERQKYINPYITDDMRAKSDPAFRGLWADGAGAPADGWRNAKHARSEAVGSVLGQLGKAGNESSELGIKRAFAANLESIAARARDLPEAQGLADEAAAISKRLFDTFDSVGIAKRNASNVRDMLQSGQTKAGVVAMAGALAGSPSLALPAVAARWLMGSVMRAKDSLALNIAKGVERLATKGARAAGALGPPGGLTRGVRANIANQQREKNLAHYQAMLDPMSPQLKAAAVAADALNQHAPGLGDAALQHEIQVAAYVDQFLPKPPSTAVFSPPPRLTPWAKSRLDRTLTAVAAPGKTLDRILRGYATDEDLDAMRTLYPAQYQRMTDAIMDQITAQPEKVDRSMYMYLSKVTGQPLTPALMTLQQNQARAQAATAGVEQAGAPKGQGANGADGVTKRAPMSLDPNKMYAGRADAVMDRE